MKLSEIPRKPPKIILCGESGTGKSALAMTLGEGTIYVDLDDGLMTGVTFKDQWYERRQQVEVKRCVEEDPSKALAFGKARSYMQGIADSFIAGKPICRAVVVDSLTTLADAAMRMVLANNNRLGLQPQKQHWGMRDLALDGFFNVLYALPCVVVMVAHLQLSGDEAEGEGGVAYRIAMQGKAYPPKLPVRFDEIWLTKMLRGAGGRNTYAVSTQASGLFSCRTRYNLPDNQDANQGLPALLGKIGFEWK